ncbi:MAG: hypothetical protein NT059_01050 [Planctomycetota bacterium]|nr:hypothetical protein [Planctomycetota bacterium]
MPGFLATLRTLFLGGDESTASLRRTSVDRIDAVGTMPVPADSQEIVTMAREFRMFLDVQDQRQQELARVVAALPQSMGSLPELVRQQTRLADLVAQQLMHTRQRDDHVEKTLARITQGVEQQRDVMSLVQQQLDLNHESAMKVAEGVTTLANAVVQLQSTTDRSSAALHGLLEKTTERDAGVQKLHTALQNWMLFVAIISCMTLVGGVILAWIALESGRAPAPLPAPVAGAPIVAPAPATSDGIGIITSSGGLPAVPAPEGSAMPALGGAPEPTTGSAVPATGGATVPR